LVEENKHGLTKNQALENRLSARTDALKESNQELLSTLEKLHQFQGQLVETEKMASLGDMVAGIAHEVNTPIGLGVTASSLLADRLNEIKQAFDSKTLKSSQLKKFLTNSDENIAIIFRNLERAAKLISSFKKVAVDQSSAENRTFNVLGLLDEVLLTLSAKLESANVSIEINCPKNLLVNSKPGPINQILINLILNSIYHAFDGLKHGNIVINVMILSDQLHINYSDDGIGIDDSVKDKIFDPFTTTKRGSGGSGLGMHLVYNLVTQALDGHIILEDDLDHGVSFDITFPVELAEG
jgi:signal transduction histidine kinase